MVADPVFEPSDGRVASLPAQSADSATNGRESDSQRFAHWPRLPGTHREALAIRERVLPIETNVLLGFEATRNRVLDELSGYPMVHFATHGYFNESYPELSAVVLSLVDPEGMPIDGFLRVQDLSEVHLDAELVVLSGCRTARGAEIFGTGTVGLSQALSIAGARQIVANLWDADDEATAVLMAAFYEGLARGLRPPAALASAQRRLIDSERWSDPTYWAGFQVSAELPRRSTDAQPISEQRAAAGIQSEEGQFGNDGTARGPERPVSLTEPKEGL